VVESGHPTKIQDTTFTQQGTADKDADDNDDGTEHQKKEANVTEESSGFFQSAISWKVYASYLVAYGGFIYWAAYAFINIAAHLLMLAQGAWVGVWVNSEDRHERVSFYFGIYAVIQVSGGAFLTLMYLYLIAGSISASSKLHQKLTDSIFGAPIRWFDRTPPGRVVNRFSKGVCLLCVLVTIVY
jgi:ABC-type multidrug transport system fused ATPase/permease subunit